MDQKKICASEIKKPPLLTIFISLVCMAAFLSTPIASRLIFDREAILNGQVWRLLSCHLVHFTPSHLIYNLFAFVIASWILERKSLCHLLIIYSLTAVSISMALLIFAPDMDFYGGVSGMACGLLYYCALLKQREPHLKGLCRCVLLCIPIKLALETYHQTSVLPYFEPQPFVMMPVSHIAGVVSAILLYGVISLLSAGKSRRNFHLLSG